MSEPTEIITEAPAAASVPESNVSTLLMSYRKELDNQLNELAAATNKAREQSERIARATIRVQAQRDLLNKLEQDLATQPRPA